MPSGSKKRKAAKKKKGTEAHAQTTSIPSPEESGNEHEDDVSRAQTHGQAGEGGEKDRAFGVESGSPICRTNALNQKAFAEEHTGEISVGEDYHVESLEFSVDGQYGGRDKSKQGVESYEGESDKNVSIQKVGSPELSGSIQSMGAQRVSDQKTTNGLVELALAEAEYESESNKSSLTTYQEGTSGADFLKLESGHMPVGGVHTDAFECREDQGGYAISDSVVRSGLDGEASIDLKDTQGFKEGPLTSYQQLSSDAGSLKLELPVIPDSVVHAEPVEFQEEQGGQGINDSLVHSRLGVEASSRCEDTQGFGKDSVTLHQELSGDVDSLKLESAEFRQDQGGRDTNGRLVHSRLNGEASTHHKDTHDFGKDSVMLHRELSCHSDSPKLKLAGSPVSVVLTEVVEVQPEQEGHAIDRSLVRSRFLDTGDVVKDSVMPHRELSIRADSLKSESDSTPTSVVHTGIEFEQEQEGRGFDGSLVHSRFDGEASTHSEDTGDVGKDSVKPNRELGSDTDSLKAESDVTPVHTEAVEFQQEQGGHGIDDILVLSRLDGEASTSSRDTKGFVKDSVILHQELSVVVDSPKKLESADVPVYAVCPAAFQIPQEQGQDVHHSLVHLSLGEAGNQFKEMEDFGKEVSIPASGEKDSDAHEDGVLLGNRLSDIRNEVEDTHITSSVSLVPTEGNSVVTQEEASPLESKVVCVSLPGDKSSTSQAVADTSQTVADDTETSLNKKDTDVALHHQSTANKAVAVRRGLLASWKSCFGFLEVFRGSRS